MRRRTVVGPRTVAALVLSAVVFAVLVVVMTPADPFAPGPRRTTAAAAAVAPSVESETPTATPPATPTPTRAPSTATPEVVAAVPVEVSTEAAVSLPVSGGAAAEDPVATPRTARLTRMTQRTGSMPVPVPVPVPVASSATTPPPAPVAAMQTSFGVGTLNILGSQHRSGGPARAAALAGAIQDRDVAVVGLQEVQSDQLSVLEDRLAGYSLWPGRALGRQGLRLQIAYRDDLFELVDAGWITTTFDHQERPVPWAELRVRSTGVEFYVVDVHNSPGSQAVDRWAATTEEIALLVQLRATGRPTLLVGDLNDRTTTACRVAAATGMVGSDGLAARTGCRPGAGPVKIDHLLGGGAVTLTDHTVDYDAPVSTSTDHAFVHATATLTAAPTG